MLTPATTTHTAATNQNKRFAKAPAQSLNHLLNFTLPPRQSHYNQSIPRRARKTGNQYGVWNKERFVNAQYRFVMKPIGDYTVHFADPDITSEQLKWVRCPICFDSVNERQLKAVKWLDEVPAVEGVDDIPIGESSSSASMDRDPFATPQSGGTLRMRLMQRPQITTLALPRSSTWPSDLLPPHQAPFHFLPDVLAFAKFMLATPSDLIQDLSKDLDDLATERRLLAGMGDELGAVFIDSADAKVRHQIEKAAALDTPHLREVVEVARRGVQELSEHSASNRQRKEEVHSVPAEEVPQAFLAMQGASRELTPTPTGRNPRQRRNLNPPPPSTSTYYYYQAANGLPVFLHPLDIKILLSHFHSYPAFPDEIVVRVESHTESTVNDDLRKRCKYLAHLPEGADVTFVEADLTLVVGRDGLRPFENALKARRTKRKEKGKRDDKARARAEEREKEKLAQTWHEFGYAHSAPAPASTPLDVPRPQDRDPSPADGHAEAAAAGASDSEEQDASPPQPAGAWGARSFASAATSAQSRVQSQTPRASAASRNNNHERAEDEWELDMAFHELEQRSAKGVGKKRNNRLVVLGGGGGRRAR
ncbi:hypothetical protein GSI_06245 [Ganoderma sinense ZZ0214-1]|uniref:Uncharacterized protein n=1 Tax=Ganoderma sinense ZZ0214-1 TaxID=1077348 RepID=A0A2G8SCS4_9APHY|nr:hypothetical protein GSI_06245 [Ganoderma sinense ZZ0214-1]